MTSREVAKAAGRLITGRIPATDLDDETAHAIKNGVMSGVTIFKDNAHDLEQFCTLIDNIRAIADDDFLIAVDQEGGAVQRLDHVIAPLPSAMALAAADNDDGVAQLMSVAAQQLKLLGINVNLVPVLDINSNPLNPIIGTRSFGDDIDTILRLSRLLIANYERNGILCVAKHFPGHGDTAQDSHLQLAVCHADRQTLEECELKPFALMLEETRALLVAHVWLPALDKQSVPASLSPTVVTDLLRNKMKFDGFIMTDDLPVMKAIVDHYRLEEACLLAIQAGVDNLLVSGSIEQIKQAHRSLQTAIESNAITPLRLKQSLARRQRSLPPSPTKMARPDRLRNLQELTARATDLSTNISSSSICIVKGSVPALVSEVDKYIVFSPVHQRYDLSLSAPLHKVLHKSIDEVKCPLDPRPEELQNLAMNASGKKAIVLTFRGLLNKGQLDLCHRVAEQAIETTVVATDVPYELAALKSCQNLIATFDPGLNAIRALALVLAGKAKARGRCPVKLDMPV